MELQRLQIFATILLLSNFKFLSVSFDLLTPTEVHNINGSLFGLFLYYDASIAYLGKEHLPYAVLALLLFLIFVIYPIVLLLLYSMRCFQQCLGRCGLSFHAIHIFMVHSRAATRTELMGLTIVDTLQLLILFFVLAFTLDVLFYAVGQFMLIVFAVLIAIIQPYKAEFAIYNIVDTVFILLLALWFCTVCCVWS